MTSPFRVDVHDLLRTPGTSRRVDVGGVLDDLATSVGRVEAPIEVSARLDGLVEGVWLDGVVRGTYELECVRCLTPVTESFELEASELFGTDVVADSEEGYPLTGDQIELEPLVRDVVVLGMPARSLCRDGCRGLCVQCGTNLNETACDCTTEAGHPAFEGLAQLLSDSRK
jgi:uncharacterized protein